MIGQNCIGEITDQTVGFTVIGKNLTIKPGNSTQGAEPEVVEFVLSDGDYLRLD
jgi:hypothetical protein